MEQWTGCIAGALTRDDYSSQLARGRLRGGRDPGDPPRPRARGLGDHPRPAPDVVTQAEIQLNDPQTLYRRWEDSQWNPFDDRPRARPGAVGASCAEADQELDLLGPGLADGRRGADHDEVLRPRRRLRQRGGGDLPLDPAGRRGPAHAVLRPLPGRGGRLAGDGRRPRRAGPGARSRRPSASSSTRRWSRPTRSWSPTPRTCAAKVRFVTIYHLILESTLGLTTFRFVTEYLEREGLLPGFVDGYSQIHHDETRHIGYGVWFLRESVREHPRPPRRSARRCAICCPRSPRRSVGRRRLGPRHRAPRRQHRRGPGVRPRWPDPAPRHHRRAAQLALAAAKNGDWLISLGYVALCTTREPEELEHDRASLRRPGDHERELVATLTEFEGQERATLALGGDQFSEGGLGPTREARRRTRIGHRRWSSKRRRATARFPGARAARPRSASTRWELGHGCYVEP